MAIVESSPSGRVARLLSVVLAGLVAVVWLVAATTAHAALKVELEQCRNGAPASPVACAGAAWQTGNLGAQNSHYREGDSVPFRIVITDIATAGTHTSTSSTTPPTQASTPTTT